MAINKKVLRKYRQKRNFDITPEPKGFGSNGVNNQIFVIQKHKARSLHYDFRLEIDGVLKSWAIPKGPSTNPKDKRLAVQTEDHPFDYKDFEGVIPKGNYGAGPVMIWDRGTFINLKSIPLDQCVKNGDINVLLNGSKLKGGYALVRTKLGGNDNNWLFIKMNDKKADREHNIIQDKTKSVVSNKTIEQINNTENRISTENSGQLKKVSGSEDAENKKTNKKIANKSSKKVSATDASSTKVNKKEQAKLVIEKLFGMLPGKIHHRSKISTIDPMLAVLTKDYFDSPDYLYETKWDGERIIAYKLNGSVTLLTRNNIDATQKYKAIVQAIEVQELDNFVLDGEVVAMDSTGKSNFSLLSNVMHAKNSSEEQLKKANIHYCIFDLLFIENYDLMQAPLIVRKKILQELIDYKKPLEFTKHITEKGLEFYKKSCASGQEGIMAKNIYSQYSQKRSKDWLKFKCTKGQEFIIVGFTQSTSSREGFSSLLLGYYEGKKLLYAGKVGTGFNNDLLTTLSYKLNKIIQMHSSLHNPEDVSDIGVQWVKPILVGEIAFTEWTKHGKLRHPSFKGLREDKDAKDVVKEI